MSRRARNLLREAARESTEAEREALEAYLDTRPQFLRPEGRKMIERNFGRTLTHTLSEAERVKLWGWFNDTDAPHDLRHASAALLWAWGDRRFDPDDKGRQPRPPSAPPPPQAPSATTLGESECPSCGRKARADGYVPHATRCNWRTWRPGHVLIDNKERFGGRDAILALVAETGAKGMREYQQRHYVSGRHPSRATLQHHFKDEARAAGYDGSPGRSLFDYILALIAAR